MKLSTKYMGKENKYVINLDTTIHVCQVIRIMGIYMWLLLHLRPYKSKQFFGNTMMGRKSP